MKNVIKTILQRYRLMEVFNTSHEFHLRIENHPGMALAVERHGDEISVAHYFEQNGDLMRDLEDVAVTRLVVEAGKLLDIQVV